MPRRRSPDEGEPQPLDIELFDPAVDGDEVSFGGATRPRRAGPRDRDARWAGRRRWWIIGGLVAAGVAATTFVTTNTGDDASTDPTTPGRPTTSASRPTTAPRPATTSDGPLTTVVASTFPPFVPPVGPIFRPGTTVPTISTPSTGPDGFDPDWRLYLWDTEEGPTALVAYDFATGTLEPVPLGDLGGPIRSVVATPAGPVIDAGAVGAVTPAGLLRLEPGDEDPRVSLTDGGPRLAATPVGRIWIKRLDDVSQLDLYDPATGQIVDQAAVAPGEDLIGTNRTGVPVVRGPDLRTFVLGDDTPLTDSITSPVELGWYAFLLCDQVTGCVMWLQGRPGAPTPFAARDDFGDVSIRFSPLGTHVAVANGGPLQIVEVGTGQVVTVASPWINVGDVVVLPTVLRLARDLVWTPDSEHLGLLTEDGIMFVDVNGTTSFIIVLDPSNPTRYVPLALG